MVDTSETSSSSRESWKIMAEVGTIAELGCNDPEASEAAKDIWRAVFELAHDLRRHLELGTPIEWAPAEQRLKEIFQEAERVDAEEEEASSASSDKMDLEEEEEEGKDGEEMEVERETGVREGGIAQEVKEIIERLEKMRV
ncbi:MAG: hypothetical protein M1822_006300 [Bathelium mastoideum]|nr:MAG: hypothetical protein M1822_006300 [Bathelium mastoideum]